MEEVSTVEGGYYYGSPAIRSVLLHACTSFIVIVHIINIFVHTLNLIFSGDVTIPDGMTVDSDLNGASPQFTLTCISTGGPATTVTWTRNSATAMGDAVTVLDNATTATYTHTLTVTGRTEELYRCNVSNSKPSSAAAELSVAGIVYAL